MPRKFRLDRLEIPALEDMIPKIRRRVMGKAARVIALKVREIAPDSGAKRTGKLRKSIRYSTRRAGLEGVVAAKCPHAHLVHNGTRPHEIPAPVDPAKRRAAWRFFPGGRSVQHPGSKAQPFLIQAGEMTQPDVQRVLHEGAVAALAEIAEGL